MKLLICLAENKNALTEERGGGGGGGGGVHHNEKSHNFQPQSSPLRLKPFKNLSKKNENVPSGLTKFIQRHN